MSRKAKQFGTTKQSKRRQKRKKRGQAAQPSAIVPRRRATLLNHLIESRIGQTVRVSRSISHLVP